MNPSQLLRVPGGEGQRGAERGDLHRLPELCRRLVVGGGELSACRTLFKVIFVVSVCEGVEFFSLCSGSSFPCLFWRTGARRQIACWLKNRRPLCFTI